MKVLLDFFPVLAFFITYKLSDIYTATMVLIIASFVQTITFRLIKKRFETLHLITFVISIVMGGLTILLQDESFIKWKVTVVYWLLSAVLFGYWLANKLVIKQIFEALFKQELGISLSIWRRLNAFWGLLFLAMGGINLWVAYSFSLDTWVNFKVWVTMATKLTAMIITFVVIFKYMPEEYRKMLEEADAKEEE
ncbi:MAG: septation protein IspZ [Gammaproteobacteria bacterium]|nr:septation protein IspZ [Gammaproteobacteria bacterium]NVK88816.1 septation protein IspZ [Gammaproteobacteria bacterium]